MLFKKRLKQNQLNKSVLVLFGSIAVLTFASSNIFADVHYVADSSGTDSGICVSANTPCKTLRYAISQMSASDTLEIAAGVYSGDANSLDTYNRSNIIPNGVSQAYTLFKASEDGAVEINSPFLLSTQSAYLQFEGLKFTHTSSTKGVTGHHIKILRTAFYGGPSNDNDMNFSIGTNDVTPGASDILLEDVWAYGPGGRYNILIYNSENVVVRRAIIRHDAGWATDCSNPEAGVTIYNSRKVQLQNVIVLDSIGDNQNTPCSQGLSGFYNVSNGSGGTQHEITRIVGSLAVNNDVGAAMAWDDSGSIPNALVEHSAIYNSGIGVTTNGDDKQLNLRFMTMHTGDGDGVASYGNNNQVNISNSIIYGKQGRALRYINASDVVCYANGEGNSECNISNVDPQTNGLLYLPRIEDNSVLKTLGAANTQVGATILSKVGVDQSLYGETGFDQDQGALWPWPLEARIYDDLCSYRSSQLCQSASITDYIWDLLGNTPPQETQPMPKPTGLTITKN